MSSIDFSKVKVGGGKRNILNALTDITRRMMNEDRSKRPRREDVAKEWEETLVGRDYEIGRRALRELVNMQWPKQS